MLAAFHYPVSGKTFISKHTEQEEAGLSTEIKQTRCYLSGENPTHYKYCQQGRVQ